MLELNTAIEKDILVIELEGALDSASAADFRRYFQEKVATGYRAFALDCLCLEYISSAGIAAIIDLQTQMAAQGGKMVLYQLSTETRQLLRFLQLEEKLHLASDYDEAIAALTGYRRVVPASDMVGPEELRLVEKQSTPAEEHAGEASTANAPTAMAGGSATISESSDEMVMEEQIEAGKMGLHPVGTPVFTAHTETTATTPAPAAGEEQTPRAPAPPEAKELKLNTTTKRLISCPNCKSVLRVAVAGDYLCPACRFRFVFRPG